MASRLPQRHAKIRVRGRKRRPEGDDTAVAIRGLAEFPALLERHAEIVECIEAIGVECRDPAATGDDLF